MLDPVMLEVKKLRTLQRKGGEMDKVKVLEKTRKYLVSPTAVHALPSTPLLCMPFPSLNSTDVHALSFPQLQCCACPFLPSTPVLCMPFPSLNSTAVLALPSTPRNTM